MGSDRSTKQIIVLAVALVAVMLSGTEAILAWNKQAIPTELATLAFGAVTGMLGLLGKTDSATGSGSRATDNAQPVSLVPSGVPIPVHETSPDKKDGD